MSITLKKPAFDEISDRLIQRQFYLRLLPGVETCEEEQLAVIGSWALLPVLKQDVRTACAAHGKHLSTTYSCLRNRGDGQHDARSNNQFEAHLARVLDMFGERFETGPAEMFLRVGFTQQFRSRSQKSTFLESSYVRDDQQDRYLRIAQKAAGFVGRADLHDLVELSDDITTYLRAADEFDIVLARPIVTPAARRAPSHAFAMAAAM